MPPADLLARIAKALEEYQANGDRVAESILGIEARYLLPECAAALKIAVEALQEIAGTHYDDAGSLDEPVSMRRARAALSRLGSTPGKKAEPRWVLR